VSKEIFIELRSAVYPPGDISIAVNRGQDRVNQIESGLVHFFKHLNSSKFKGRTSIFFIDNTIGSQKELPAQILDILISNGVEILINNKNDYGSKNKGAGDIDLWREHFNKINEFKWFLHFEPRTILQSPIFLEECLKSPRNLFKVFYPNESPHHFYTGIFMIGTKELKHFIDSVNLDKMVKDKESIEYTFKNFMDEKYSDTYQDYTHKLNILWHDAQQDRFIEF
jgi:hypothetical protein